MSFYGFNIIELTSKISHHICKGKIQIKNVSRKNTNDNISKFHKRKSYPHFTKIACNRLIDELLGEDVKNRKCG